MPNFSRGVCLFLLDWEGLSICPECGRLAGDYSPCLEPEFLSPTRMNAVPLRGCTSLGFKFLDGKIRTIVHLPERAVAKSK